MGTEVANTDFRETFRSVAASRFHAAADMTLHQLVDEFARLSAIIAANLVKDEHGYTTANDTGKVAARERNVILGAVRARFNLSFDTYDSGEPGSESF